MIDWLMTSLYAHPVAFGIGAFLILSFALADPNDSGDGGPHGWTYDPRGGR
jgi:hypothetical protein